MSDFASRSALELRAGYRARELSPVEVVAELGERITRSEPALNAFMTLRLEQAAEEARQAEAAYARGEARPLEGIPFAVKDLIDAAGIRATYGSPMFDRNVPREDARCVAKAKAAGAILLGKTNTDEFAYGITNVNEHYGPSRNPWDRERVSGGSSGGSGVAVGARDVPLAIGTDTGGSIRAPASFCGIVGLKPTWGAISTRGVFPMAPSFDHVGPMARTPADAALFLDVLADVRPWDARDSREVRDLATDTGRGIAGMRVGLCPDLHLLELSPDVQSVFDSAVETLRGLGAEIVEVSFRGAGKFFDTHAWIRDAEILDSHKRVGIFPNRRDEYSPRVYALVEVATRVGLDELLAAMEERRRLGGEFERLFDSVDALLLPLHAKTPLTIETDDVDLRVFLESVGPYAVPENLLGVPACAFRAGFDSLGLPVGLQLVARTGADPAVLRAAQAYYDATPDVQGRWPDV